MACFVTQMIKSVHVCSYILLRHSWVISYEESNVQLPVVCVYTSYVSVPHNEMPVGYVKNVIFGWFHRIVNEDTLCITLCGIL